MHKFRMRHVKSGWKTGCRTQTGNCMGINQDPPVQTPNQSSLAHDQALAIYLASRTPHVNGQM